MAESTFAFGPIEQTLEMFREERPEVVAVLSERLARLLDDLGQTYQGWVASAIEAEDLLDRLREAFVGRMMAEMEPWREDEELRRAVVELLTRHLDRHRDFVHRVVALKRD